MDFDAHALRFQDVLIRARYRPNTARAYLAALDRASRGLPADGLIPAAAARLWLAWADHPEEHPYTTAARAIELGREGLDGVKARKTTGPRKHEARSIVPAEWAALQLELGDTPEDAVIRVLAQTGLRVGDTLAIPHEALEQGARTGVVQLYAKGGKRRLLPWAGAPEAWAQLAAHTRPGWTVADAVMGQPGSVTHAQGGAAYQRVRRRIQTLGEGRVTGRAHAHRLRRTVAVQALRATEDLVAVRELLGHESIVTTSKYLDEARPDAIAALQQKIRTGKAKRDE